LCPPAAAISRARRAWCCPRISQVHRRRSPGRNGVGGLGRLPRPAEETHRPLEVRRRYDAEAVDEGGLGRVGLRDHDDARPVARGGDRRREDAGGRNELATQRHFAEEHDLVERANRNLRGGDEHRDRDRGVETWAVLAHVRGREVDDDPAQRPLETGVFHRGTDAIARVLRGGAWQPGERQRRQPSTDEGLDHHPVPADADDRDPGHPSVHGRDGIRVSPGAP